MKSNAKIAFDALRKIGAPVINHCENGESLSDQWGAHFILSGERESDDSGLWADYYGEEIVETVDEGQAILNAFGIRESVHEILRASDLYAEWIDPGTLGIYDA